MRDSDYLQKAGESGRSAGYNYEDVIINEINKKTYHGIKIIDFIAKDINLNINSYSKNEIFASKQKSSVKDLTGIKVPPKNDIYLHLNGFRYGVSLKSSNSSVQVQITNVDRFKTICELYDLNFTNGLYIALAKFCGWRDYKPNDFEKKKLKQGHRNRWLFYELTPQEQDEIKLFFTNHEKSIIEIVLKKGSHDIAFHPQYYLVNRNEFSKTFQIDFDIKNIDSVINTATTGFTATTLGSFHIGKITVQMKGSGKKGGTGYHGLQFNKSGI